MNIKMDPMGRAIANYWKTKTADRLRVFSPMFEEDEIPMTVLFRKYKAMPEIEGKALDMATGKTLDVGAGAGCHSLVLQEKGIDVTAIDISPLSVETMKERGVKKVKEQDFFTLEGQSSDISYVFEGEDGMIDIPDEMEYYGEHSFRMQYKDTIGEPFYWLYIDADTLKEKAAKNGYAVEVVAEGEHYDYLARIKKQVLSGVEEVK